MNERETSSGALREAGSAVVAGRPEEIYDMVADVTRMGEWSPVCRACRWEPGHALRIGARFTGHNELSDRTWETHAEVVVADRGREFAFVIAETGTRWGYTFTPVRGGTRVTESWEIPERAVEVWKDRAGPEVENQIVDRVERTRTEIAATLAAIKKAAESTKQ